MFGPGIGGLQQTTNYRVVLPFYIYASASFLMATLLLFLRTDLANDHYFYPPTLAITHIMALGWGTMIILGASHQLLPVLIEGKLDSDKLAYATFGFTSIGIPILVIGFYIFNTGWIMVLGALMVNIGVLLYVSNVILSASKSEKRNVHAWFIITASLWLFSTTFFGLLLVINFDHPILPKESLAYLAIHAHLGLVGWFLLLVMGVGSRLIPMFLISKYTNEKMLWAIYALVNTGLIVFILARMFNYAWEYPAIAFVLAAIILFGRHCYKAYTVRIRRAVDEQMKASLLSVIQMLLPFAALIISILILPSSDHPNMALLYGFCILFGWITAIILGMTFKTLPFIVWNKVYRKKAHAGKTPLPKDLFSEKIYHYMLLAYVTGFVVFLTGIVILNQWVLKLGAAALLMAAILYVFNTTKILTHQPVKK